MRACWCCYCSAFARNHRKLLRVLPDLERAFFVLFDEESMNRLGLMRKLLALDSGRWGRR